MYIFICLLEFLYDAKVEGHCGNQTNKYRIDYILLNVVAEDCVRFAHAAEYVVHRQQDHASYCYNEEHCQIDFLFLDSLLNSFSFLFYSATSCRFFAFLDAIISFRLSHECHTEGKCVNYLCVSFLKGILFAVVNTSECLSRFCFYLG